MEGDVGSRHVPWPHVSTIYRHIFSLFVYANNALPFSIQSLTDMLLTIYMLKQELFIEHVIWVGHCIRQEEAANSGK